MAFDNPLKRIHLSSGSGARIANGPPDAFCTLWLRRGTGGTYWPSAGGLHALLVSLGFDANRRATTILLDDDVSAEHYFVRSEASRGTSPFNTALYATRNTDDARVTLAVGTRFERRADGIASTPLGDDRDRILVEEFGCSEEIVAQVPPDET